MPKPRPPLPVHGPTMSSRIRFAAPSIFAALVGLAVQATSGLAETSRIFTASDLPRLRRGITLPESGDYTLKVWSSATSSWTAVEGDGPDQITLSPGEADEPAEPRWQDLGSFRVEAGARLKIRVAGIEDVPEPPKIVGDYRSGEQTIEGGSLSRVPALLAISNASDFDPAPALEILRGRLDSDAPPEDSRRTSVRTNHEGAGFEAPGTLGEWRERADEIRRRLLVSVGLWPMPPRTPLNPRIYGKVERDGYSIEKVALETLPGFVLAGNLYRPAPGTPSGGGERRPVILCPHGHYADGRVNPEVQARCIQWARLGCVVFVYDMVGYNDSKDFGHTFLNDRLRRWGLSLVTLQTWNSVRALDWVRTLPDVDPARVACTGSSGGGTQTFLLTAIDERVKLAAPVVMVSDSFQGGCSCENCAGLRIGLDNVAVAALTAPRPMKLVGATGDWTSKTLTNAYPKIRDIYTLYGVPERISADVFDFPHNYNQTTREAVYAFLAPRLLPGLDAEQTGEGEQSLEAPEDLFAFNDNHPRPGSLRTPEQLEVDLVGMASRQLGDLAPGTRATPWEASRQVLATSHRVRVGLVNPPGAGVAAGEVRELARDGVAVQHHEVGREADDTRIAVVSVTPAESSGRVAVLFAPRGKAALVNARGVWTPLVRTLLDEGVGVVAFDPLFVGESVDPAAYATRRPETVHFDTYNPSLAADRLQDLATVVAWTRTLPDVQGVSLVGVGRWGPLALLALPALEGIERAAIDLNEFGYGDGTASVPADLDLSGVLQFGGLPAAASLAAPVPLWLHGVQADFSAGWATNAYELAGSSQLLRLDRDHPRPKAIAAWIKDGR